MTTMSIPSPVVERKFHTERTAIFVDYWMRARKENSSKRKILRQKADAVVLQMWGDWITNLDINSTVFLKMPVAKWLIQLGNILAFDILLA